MKNFTTAKVPIVLGSYFVIVILILIPTSISCAEVQTDSLNKDSQKYLSFYETVDDERIHWEVNFFGDEITSIYKNGKRIPDDLLADYKEKVYDQLDEMRFGEKQFSFKMPVIVGDEFDFNFDELNKELEELKKDFPDLGKDLPPNYFDSEKFKKEMEDMKKELEENKSKIYKFKWNDEEFKKQMEELKKELKENLIKPEDLNFYFEEIEECET